MKIIKDKLIIDGKVFNITPVKDNDRELWILGEDNHTWEFIEYGYYISEEGVVRNELGKIMKQHERYGELYVHLKVHDGSQRFFKIKDLLNEYHRKE